MIGGYGVEFGLGLVRESGSSRMGGVSYSFLFSSMDLTCEKEKEEGTVVREFQGSGRLIGC